jgi:hypothetical protein
VLCTAALTQAIRINTKSNDIPTDDSIFTAIADNTQTDDLSRNFGDMTVDTILGNSVDNTIIGEDQEVVLKSLTQSMENQLDAVGS